MPDRTSRESMLMEIAHVVAKRGTCSRLKVGAVIAKESRPISIGYNGAVSGDTHCSPEVCQTDSPCQRTVHAEANAIAFAAREGIAVAGCTLYCTDSPCEPCAKLIINSGISFVYYDREYRDTYPLQLLIRHGVKVERWCI